MLHNWKTRSKTHPDFHLWIPLLGGSNLRWRNAKCICLLAAWFPTVGESVHPSVRSFVRMSSHPTSLHLLRDQVIFPFFHQFSTIFNGNITFLVADTQLYKRLCPSVRRLVGRLVGWSVTLELKRGKMRISAPAHPSATDGRVSGLVKQIKILEPELDRSFEF